ncbi:cardiolipin synthase [bacterium]|nr:cardiolipin synthase [bacterium]
MLFRLTVGNRTALFVESDERSRARWKPSAGDPPYPHAVYILASDATGQEFAEVLCRKAREGVRVRLLLDGVGCLRLSSALVRRLREAGVRVEFFLPIRKWNRFWNFNLRNHRKIIVVDGRTGFCGGLNLADEYRGRSRVYGPWQDAHMQVDGPAATQLQWVFAEDWYFACGEELGSEYFPEQGSVGEDVVQVVASGPDRDVEIMYEFFFTAITTARESVWIITPYFVPDRAMLLALMTAARRGVDVTLLVPERCDHRVVQWAGRYYYEDVLAAGVKIFEYPDGTLHAKVMLVDGAWATVGSANMDIRSFRLNFEVNLIVFGRDIAERVAAAFARDLKISRPVVLEAFRRRGRRRRLLENVFRLVSPML